MSSLSWVFRWDLPNKTVEMGQEKKDKYKDAFKELMSHATHTLDDIQKIYGKLLHTSLVATANSRTRLPHQLGSHAGNLQYKSSRFTPLTPRHQKRPPMVALLLQRRKKLSRRIPGPCGLRTMARSLMLVPDLELRLSSKIAGEPGGSSWVGTLKGETLDGPKQLFSSSSSMLSSHLVSLASIVFRQVHDILSARECTGITRYVTSRENPADAPSRDIYPPPSVLLPLILIPGALRLLFTDLDSLPSHRELELRALGPRCSSMY
jgi:hypothetical protein